MTQERIDIEAYIQQFTAVDEIDETEQLTSAGLAAIAELKRCYEELDVLEELLRTGLMDEEIYNQVKASM